MSAILKAGTRPAGLVSPSSFHMRDLLAEAEVVVLQARRQAAELLAAARRQAEDLRDTARREGHAQGHGEGLAAGREAGQQQALVEAGERFATDQQQLVQTLETLIGAVSQERLERLHAAERQLLDFALAVARRVTHGIGRIEPGVAQANLEAALSRVVKGTDFVIYAHSQDRAALEQFAPHAAQRLEGTPHLQVLSDDTVARGGVRLQAGDSEIDATLEGQLDMICRALTGRDHDSDQEQA